MREETTRCTMKRKLDNEEEGHESKKIASDEPDAKKVKWKNRQRVLIFATRGISYRHRHLMGDLKTLMPHHRPENKIERTKNLQVINEVCEMKHCNKAFLFEGRKKRDLYIWLSNVPSGPSVKFLVENINTMKELKMTGNCLKGSRPLLSFDENFTKHTHYILLKELLTQIFGVPNNHPKSQPFFDHVYIFSILDNRIWFRNFQILNEDGAVAEIGPRFVLNPVKIFAGSFTGQTLWENPHYITPAKYRHLLTKKAANKYTNKVEQKMAREATKSEETYDLNPTDEIFKGDVVEKAVELEEKLEAWEKRRKAETQDKKIKKKKVHKIHATAKPVQEMKRRKAKLQTQKLKKKKVKKTSAALKPVQQMKFVKSKTLKKKKMK